MSHWYKWNSLQSFNVWHNYVKDQLGIPHPNYNLQTGELQVLDAYWTLEYTDPVIVADDDVRAIVEEEGKAFKEGLGEPCDSPPKPSDDIFAQQLKK